MNQAPNPSEPAAADTQPQADFARGVLESEARAIERIVIGPAFHQAVELMLNHAGEGKPGTVVVSGLGKSGIVGQKISATLASTGTPSHFMHPVEAMHGDLGKVRRGDVVLVLSYGGTTQEVVDLATILRQDAVPVIAIVGKPDGDLGRIATVALCIGDVEEACPLNLAPTTSTTAMLALGDALALSVSRRRRFGVEDYRKVHPGGNLGRQIMPVVEVMRFHAGQNLALIPPEVSVEQAYALAESAASHLRRAGALLIVDQDGRLAGIFTDGDLRRMFIKHGGSAWQQPIGRFMTRNPRRLTDAAVVRDAVQLVRELRIDEIPVVDADGKPLGLIDVQDLMALKVIEG